MMLHNETVHYQLDKARVYACSVKLYFQKASLESAQPLAERTPSALLLTLAFPSLSMATF